MIIVEVININKLARKMLVKSKDLFKKFKSMEAFKIMEGEIITIEDGYYNLQGFLVGLKHLQKILKDSQRFSLIAGRITVII